MKTDSTGLKKPVLFFYLEKEWNVFYIDRSINLQGYKKDSRIPGVEGSREKRSVRPSCRTMYRRARLQPCGNEIMKEKKQP